MCYYDLLLLLFMNLKLHTFIGTDVMQWKYVFENFVNNLIILRNHAKTVDVKQAISNECNPRIHVSGFRLASFTLVSCVGLSLYMCKFANNNKSSNTIISEFRVTLYYVRGCFFNF